MVVCVGGGININWLVRAAACCVCGLVSAGGAGGGWCGGGTVAGGGGGGGYCAGSGSRRPCGSCGCCVCSPCSPCGPWLVAVPRCGWQVAAWPSGWACGPYVMGGCRWMVLAGMGCGWVGCWWWWGAPTRPWCCWCACAAPRGSMGVYCGPCVVSPCSGAAGGAGPRGGGVVGVLVVCGTPAFMSVVVGAGGGGIRDCVVR